MTPNWFATVVLFSWPLVALWLYRTRPANQATLWTILGAQMLLPTALTFKLDMIPAFDKYSVSNLAALIGCALVTRRPLRFWYRFGLVEVLLLMYLLGPFVTSELNKDSIVIGLTWLPGVGHYDALSAIVAQFIFLLPFFLGRHLLRSSVDAAEILRVLVIAGLLYSLPMLFEIRMSPQLNYWVYGYIPYDSFIQEIRRIGFRPMVFMGHGLVASFFIMTTAVAAAALWRTQARVQRFPPGGVVAYLSTILILCQSMGALVYGAILLPLVRFAKPRLQVRVAVMFVSLVLLYPVLRAADLVPTKSMVEAASLISADRAESLKQRLGQEERLLQRASERFLFGWGRFGRSRVYSEEGQDISVTDGLWVITLGVFGFVGFLAQFGLLALPVFRTASALRFTQSMPDKIVLAALALILGINVIDLLPNSTLLPWTWLLAGALLGRAESLLASARQPRTLELSSQRA